MHSVCVDEEFFESSRQVQFFYIGGLEISSDGHSTHVLQTEDFHGWKPEWHAAVSCPENSTYKLFFLKTDLLSVYANLK